MTTQAQESKAQTFQDGKVKLYIPKYECHLTVDQADELLEGINSDQIQTLPVNVIASMISTVYDKMEAEKQAKKGSQRREKQTPREKFLKRAHGEMANGIRLMIREMLTSSYHDDKELTTTHQNMARRYGPPTLAVLYDMGLLEPEMEQIIEREFPNTND